MNKFVIITDSSCDLTAKMAAEMELDVLPLSVQLDGKEYINYLDERDITFEEFYAKLPTAENFSTSAANVKDFAEAMEKHAAAGRDVLCLAFSSGLSNTANAARIAGEETSAKFPERKIFVVDTLCASLGQGLLVWLCHQKKLEGATIEEVRDYAVKTVPNLCHWFTVDDLTHLKKGGRISKATEIIGKMLNIKPILHVDDDGKLASVSKTRGRKASIEALCDKIGETAFEPEKQTMFISHGGCEQDAKLLANMIREKYGTETIYINYVGPVIGAHSGPGTLALFFLGSKR